MKKQYNLPAFADPEDQSEDTSQKRFPAAVESGVWRASQDSLATLSASLKAADGGSVDTVKSVPDPWAQPRTFADAIIRKGHPQASASIPIWRGLLALFALESLYADVYSLSFKPVALEASKNPLARILKALPPKVTLPQDVAGNSGSTGAAEWIRPILVQIRLVRSGHVAGHHEYEDPRTIALFNPVSLVSPARDVQSLAVPGIEWMRNGLADPTRLQGRDQLSEVNLLVLEQYLAALIADLPEDGGDLTSRLRTQLIAYRDDVRARLTSRPPVGVNLGSPQNEGVLPALYAKLRRPVSIVIDEPERSSGCVVQLREELSREGGPFRGVILCDDQVALARGQEARNVFVWGRNTIADLADGNRFRAVHRTMAEQGYLLVRRSDLFTPSFAQLGREARVAGNPDDFKSALIPLTPLALLLLGPEAIRSGVKVRWDGSERCTVSLQLNLAGVPLKDGAYGEWASPPAVMALEQTFATDPADGEGLLRKDVNWTYGDVAIWPDFYSPDWHNYFARITYTKRGERARARFALSGSALRDYLDKVPLDERATTIAPWLAPIEFGRESVEAYSRRELSTSWLDRIRSVDNDAVIEEIQTSKHAFEAIFFTATEAAGLALLNLERADSHGDGGVVGLDFGTTNTVVCLDDGDPVELKNRVVHPIGSSNKAMIERAGDSMRWPFVNFMPPAERSTPTPTVVLDQVVDRVEELKNVATLEDDRILFSHVIYFQPETAADRNRSQSDIDQLKDVLGRARFNLKWDDDDVVKQASHRFLRQLMLMVAAEALVAGKRLDALEWRFSRPDAMHDSHDDFRTMMRRRLTQIVPGADPEARVRQVYSEAVAAGNFILSGGGANFVPGPLNVVMDIGGGTTDVTFWNVNGDPLWKGSYRLAGGDFFTSYIVNNPDFLSLLGLEGWAAILGAKDSGKSGIKAKRLYVGELLFSGPALGDALRERWIDKSGREEAKALVRAASVFLGGVVFQLGLVARRLVETGKLNEATLERVTFALGGRGAGLFAQLHAGGPDDETDISKLLNLFNIAAGKSQTPRPSLYRSSQPKLEVARGMVIANAQVAIDDSSLLRGIPIVEPIGLGIEVGDTVLSSDAEIHDLPHTGAVKSIDLAEFNRFVDALTEQARFKVNLTAGGGQSTEFGVRNAIERAVRDAQKPTIHGPGELKEPLFITALRAVLNEMTSTRGSSQLQIIETKRT